MSNVSIFEKKWIDLVFEGKNKEYGAYQLRNNNSKTTITAFLFGLTFIASISGLGFLLSSFGETPKPFIVPESPNDSIIVVDVKYPPIDQPKSPETVAPKKETAEPIVPEHPKYKAVETSNATQEVPKNSALPTTNNTPTGGDTGTGTAPSGGTNTGTSTSSSLPIPDNGPVKTFELDRQPAFPGGIKSFYEYVSTNFEKQEIEDESVRVMVSFVIEKNGAMSNITVLKNTNPAVDREAIRVLKSLKTKWSPGIKDNQAVRTQFTLPITIVM